MIQHTLIPDKVQTGRKSTSVFTGFMLTGRKSTSVRALFFTYNLTGSKIHYKDSNLINRYNRLIENAYAQCANYFRFDFLC